jgi:hypothetical protein
MANIELTTSDMRDDAGIGIGNRNKWLYFTDPECSASVLAEKARLKAMKEAAAKQDIIPGVKEEEKVEPPRICNVSTSALTEGSIGTFEISDLAQWLMRHYPQEVGNALSVQQDIMARVGVVLKTT